MSQQEKTTDEIIDTMIEALRAQIKLLEKDIHHLKDLRNSDDKDFKEWFLGGNGSGAPRGIAFGGGSGGSSARGFYDFGGGGAGIRGFYEFVKNGGGSHAGNGFYGLFGGFSVGNNVANDGDRVGNG